MRKLEVSSGEVYEYQMKEPTSVTVSKDSRLFMIEPHSFRVILQELGRKKMIQATVNATKHTAKHCMYNNTVLGYNIKTIKNVL